MPQQQSERRLQRNAVEVQGTDRRIHRFFRLLQPARINIDLDSPLVAIGHGRLFEVLEDFLEWRFLVERNEYGRRENLEDLEIPLAILISLQLSQGPGDAAAKPPIPILGGRPHVAAEAAPSEPHAAHHRSRRRRGLERT